LARAPVISIVDDDQPVREATRNLIRSLGYTAVTFTSAEEYLRSDRLHDTACLITDVMMPGMTGIELQRRLIADGHRTPIIFMTAHPEEQIRGHALEAGAVGFLSKPFDDDQLIQCIDRALQSDQSGASG
jgi:FixJ family two-component response regulator